MGKIKRGNYIFISWIGDHTPKHVHVYRDKQFVMKWNLESNELIEGKMIKKVVKLIEELQEEGKL